MPIEPPCRKTSESIKVSKVRSV